jgi:hypothetical protein
VRGLLGRDRLERNEALLLPGAGSVHTFGMRFPVTVARLDSTFAVLDVRVVPPRRLLLPHRGARHVLECAAGVDLREGDHLRPGWIGGPAQAGQPPRPAAPVTTQDPA